MIRHGTTNGRPQQRINATRSAALLAPADLLDDNSWCPFSRHVFADVVKGLTTRLHSQRANATSTPAFFPHPRRPAKRPATEPESKLQYHRLVHDPHPEQCEQPDDDECGKWKGGVGTGAIVVVVRGGTRVPRGGSAVLHVAGTVESIQALSPWRAESGGGGGREEEIGFIALLPAVWLSRIATAATDRTCTHVALSVDGDDDDGGGC
ncbi:hypothetical protein DFH94DRAFT_771444 [Russula ochroleuca]|jgi:hypothetical protein|uniref:Uncharacterized protein n=1 Tax=Russula ochroleuca TaxID=152965 RepID=A0A9P5JYD9_9AGAM|nr:hypothetical protein DFH94DRAFT_771444 [Russula ochroleuca]